ncbi:MAG TPA: hypothetical protein VKN14_09805 [Flavobacteriaceae bacterium]|nr:hypothetical protein [Flavobacteriaceae bacterium]
MNSTKPLLFAFSIVLIFLFSCQHNDISTEEIESNSSNRPAKTKGKKKNNNDGGTDETTNGTFYQIVEYIDHDPLFQFETQGNQITFFTDASIGVWGTDYYGYWSDPYSFNNNVVEYTIGLSTATYTFSETGNNSYHVTKQLVVQPYNSNGEPTTTLTDIGFFEIMN